MPRAIRQDSGNNDHVGADPRTGDQHVRRPAIPRTEESDAISKIVNC